LIELEDVRPVAIARCRIPIAWVSGTEFATGCWRQRDNHCAKSFAASDLHLNVVW